MAVQPFITMRRLDWTIRWPEFMKDCLDLAGDLVLDWEGISCTSWCGDGIEVLTGDNPFDPFRNRFGTPLSAAKMIMGEGFQTLDELIAAIFPQEVPIAFAQTGDLVLVRAPDWAEEETLSRVMPHATALADPPFYWAVTSNGLAKGDLYTGAVRAFAVGRLI